MGMQLDVEDDRRLVKIETKLDNLLEKVSNLITKQSLTDARLTNVENAPAQGRAVWNLSFNGCATIAMAVSAVCGALGTLTAIAALIVALVK